METDETIKKGFLRLERYAQNIPGGFHCCTEDPENGYPFAYVTVFWRYWAGSGKNLRQGSITAIQR